MSDGTSGGAGKRGLKEKLFHPFNHKASEKIEEIQSKLASTKLEKPMIKVVHAKHKAGKITRRRPTISEVVLPRAIASTLLLQKETATSSSGMSMDVIIFG
jgi:hypothetical protein